MPRPSWCSPSPLVHKCPDLTIILTTLKGLQAYILVTRANINNMLTTGSRLKPVPQHTCTQSVRDVSIDDIRSRQVGDWREILYEFWVNPGGIFLLIPPNAYLYRERSTCIIHLHSQAGFLHKDNAEKSLAFWVTPVPILGWCFLQGCLLDPWRVWPFLLRSHSNQIIRLPSLHPQLSTSTHVQSYQFPYIIQIQPNHVLPIHRPLGIYIQRVSFSTLSVWAGRPFSLNDLRTDNHHHLVMLVLRQLEDLMLLNATSTTSSSTPDSQ